MEAMISVDILEYLHGQQPFENVFEVFGTSPRHQIDGCDGSYDVGHPMGCARVFKQIGLFSICELLGFLESFDLPFNFCFGKGSGQSTRIDRP